MSEDDFLSQLTFEPLSRKTWNSFVELFGPRGACGNCWCMYYRLSRQDFIEGKFNDGNRNAMMDMVNEGKPLGLLAFYEGQAIAWCAFAPREDFIKLSRSRVHKPIDNEKVWSVPCLFINKKFRRAGVSVRLLNGLIEYAKNQKIKIIEAYPVIPTKNPIPDSFAWTGLLKSFERAGFEIVDKKSVNHPMVRYYVSGHQE